MPIPMAAQSKASACGHSLAGSEDSNRAGAWLSCLCEYCVLSGRGLCD